MFDDFKSFTLVYWAYHNSDEVLLMYSNSFSSIPVFIHREDFDRAFGNIISLNLAQLISDYSFRLMNSSYVSSKKL